MRDPALVWSWIASIQEARETSGTVLRYLWLAAGGIAAIIFVLLTLRYLYRPDKREEDRSRPDG